MTRIAVVVVISVGVLIGCTGKRPAKTTQELLAIRAQDDAQSEQAARNAQERVLARAKARCDTDKDKATFDILIISGGGDWGAFGAGFLKGWGKIPPGEMARPKFDIVTGVSTGALIAPFAFVGTDDAIERVVHLYR